MWDIKWKNDCFYTLTYLYGQGSFDVAAKALKGKIAVDVNIVQATEDYYYVYKTIANKRTHALATSDTLWLKQQPGKLSTSNIKEAGFPGGLEAWCKYLNSALDQYSAELGKSKKDGTCLVQFIVDVDGTISDIKAITMKGSRIARFAVEVIKNGPKWIPAVEDGKPVRTAKIQPISLVLVDSKD